jgi:methyl-accepting chemotaxis protein
MGDVIVVGSAILVESGRESLTTPLRIAGELVRQSSANEVASGREEAVVGGEAGANVGLIDRTDEREQSILLYAGLAGAALLTGGLWLLRTWIGRASATELIAGVMLLLGIGAVLSVLTALVLLASRVDRASEEVSSALDAVAAGKLTTKLAPPRGLGREARLGGAAVAALDRLRAWIEGSRAAVVGVERDVGAAKANLPRLRESLTANSAHIQQLTRDSQFLASGAEEQAGLTQRACVLASVIGQSHRDTAAFAERIHKAVNDAASTLSECATRTADLRAAMAKQAEESGRCLEADRQLAEYLIVVSKSARQFKLLALHAAMEAARAGANAENAGANANGESEGRGAEFRVVALEVRRLALDLSKATDDMTRIVDTARRSLQAVNTSALDGGRHIEAAHGAVSLGVSALEQATLAASARRADDATLGEAGTELTILTSAIRERATGSAKGIGDIADRLTTLDQSLAAGDASAREIENALAAATASISRVNDVIGTMATTTSPQATGAALAATRTRHKKHGKNVRHAKPLGARA